MKIILRKMVGISRCEFCRNKLESDSLIVVVQHRNYSLLMCHECGVTLQNFTSRLLKAAKNDNLEFVEEV